MMYMVIDHIHHLLNETKTKNLFITET